MDDDLRQEFSATAQRLFGDHATPAVIEAAEGGRFPQALWDALDACGFGLTLLPEAHGGIGAGIAEAAAILDAAGAHAAPGPVLEAVLGNALLAAAGAAPTSEPLALAFAAQAGDARVAVRNVGWAQSARQVLVVARAGDGARLALLPGGDASLRAEIADAGGEPSARLDVPATARWLPLNGPDFDGWLRQAALLRGAQMLGAMRWCLDRTLAYTQERKQFGREIGKFQVVQQMMAETASSVVAAQAMLDAALAAPDAVALVAAARSRLGDAADTVFALTHQVHGAIGFSYEYALHFRTRRLMAWRDQFGTVAAWRRLLAQGLAGCGAGEVWPLLAA